MSLPELHCDPMLRSTRMAEANTTAASLRICLLGRLHRGCTVGIQCRDAIAVDYLRLQHRLSPLEALCENWFSVISQVSGIFSDFCLLLNLCFAP